MAEKAGKTAEMAEAMKRMAAKIKKTAEKGEEEQTESLPLLG